MEQTEASLSHTERGRQAAAAPNGMASKMASTTPVPVKIRDGPTRWAIMAETGRPGPADDGRQQSAASEGYYSAAQQQAKSAQKQPAPEPEPEQKSAGSSADEDPYDTIFKIFNSR